ncbi:hypothetical protein CXK98_17545 [Stutzerimonas kunmingensis]|nr:hypothetical protein CXK98_17545 [Stutzerimonas kunmingensis]
MTARTHDAAQLKALQVGALTKLRSIELHHGRADLALARFRSDDATRSARLFRLRWSVWSGLIDCLRTEFRAVEGALTKFRSIELHHGRAVISRSPVSALMTRPGALGYFRLRWNVWTGLGDCPHTAFRLDSDTGKFTTYCAVYTAKGIQRAPQFCIHRNLPSALDHWDTFAELVK